MGKLAGVAGVARKRFAPVPLSAMLRCCAVSVAREEDRKLGYFRYFDYFIPFDVFEHLSTVRHRATNINRIGTTAVAGRLIRKMVKYVCNEVANHFMMVMQHFPDSPRALPKFSGAFY